MSAHNWVFLRPDDNFEANFELLIDALDTDLAYIREHTRLLTRAIEWNDNNRRPSNVLRNEELTKAEGWLSISQSMQPPATELHIDYITFSRVTIKRLQSLIYSGIGIGVILVLALAGFSFHQRSQALSQKQLAKNQEELLNFLISKKNCDKQD